MKNLFSVLAVVCMVLAFSSCSKKYKCVCKDANGNSVVAWEGPSSKDAAERSCKASSLQFEEDCVLK